MNKSAIGAIALIAIMLGSSLTAGLLQAFSFRTTGNAVQNKGNAMPKSLIIDYDLSADIKLALEQKYITVVRFSYGPSCTECPSIEKYLEDMTNRANGQIRLVELSSSAAPDLTISSLNGEQTVSKLGQAEVLKTLCDLIIEPSSVTGLVGECAQVKI